MSCAWWGQNQLGSWAGWQGVLLNGRAAPPHKPCLRPLLWGPKPGGCLKASCRPAEADTKGRRGR